MTRSDSTSTFDNEDKFWSLIMLYNIFCHDISTNRFCSLTTGKEFNSILRKISLGEEYPQLTNDPKYSNMYNALEKMKNGHGKYLKNFVTSFEKYLSKRLETETNRPTLYSWIADRVKLFNEFPKQPWKFVSTDGYTSYDYQNLINYKLLPTSYRPLEDTSLTFKKLGHGALVAAIVESSNKINLCAEDIVQNIIEPQMDATGSLDHYIEQSRTTSVNGQNYKVETAA